MIDTLVELKKNIEDIRSNLAETLLRESEMVVRNGIINPILRHLGWDTTNVQIVHPEYSVGTGWVDYALCYPPSKVCVFIEVKRVGKVKDAEEQLFRYDSLERVPIAVATDGQKWIFFHPTGTGTREARKIHELDLTASDVEKNAKFLQKYLGYESVKTGKAEAAIEQDYKNIVNQRETERHLPDAWKQLLEQGDELLLELVAEKTQELCDHRPSNERVLGFLKRLQIDPQPPVIDPPRPSTPHATPSTSSKRTLRCTLDNTEIQGVNQVEVFCNVLQQIGLQRLSEIEPKVVSTEPFYDDAKKDYRQKLVNGYYVNVNNTGNTKQEILERIKEKLGIQLIIKVID